MVFDRLLVRPFHSLIQIISYASGKKDTSSINKLQVQLQKIQDPVIHSFNQALTDLNILVYIEQLENNQPIDKDQQQRIKFIFEHPWASQPKSVGSLATSYLALLYMKLQSKLQDLDEDNQEEEIQKCLELIEELSSKALSQQWNLKQILMNNLRHSENDRVEYTVSLIMFLTQNNELMQKFFFENPDLFNSLKEFTYRQPSNKSNAQAESGLQFAAIEAVCNIMSSNIKIQQQLFIEDQKFLKNIIQILEGSVDPLLLQQALQLMLELFNIGDLAVEEQEVAKKNLAAILNQVNKNDKLISTLDALIGKMEMNLNKSQQDKNFLEIQNAKQLCKDAALELKLKIQQFLNPILLN